MRRPDRSRLNESLHRKAPNHNYQGDDRLAKIGQSANRERRALLRGARKSAPAPLVAAVAGPILRFTIVCFGAHSAEQIRPARRCYGVQALRRQGGTAGGGRNDFTRRNETIFPGSEASTSASLPSLRLIRFATGAILVRTASRKYSTAHCEIRSHIAAKGCRLRKHGLSDLFCGIGRANLSGDPALYPDCRGHCRH